jgi:hypothetical protein
MYTLYTNTNYGLTINQFNSIDECIAFVQKVNPKAYKYVKTENQLPMQFYPAFFWNNDKKSPDININIAIELKKEELRTIREFLFEKLDIAFVKALELNNEELKNKIINYKNLLRNITEISFPLDWKILLEYYPLILAEIFLFVQN